MNLSTKTILHVDDDTDDQELLKQFIHEVAPKIKVETADNGLHAMKLLNATKEKDYLPCLIVLDLNMPYLNGRETFKLIKSDPKLKDIPLVVFSSGESPADKSFFNNEGILYYKKPTELSALKDIVGQMTNLCT